MSERKAQPTRRPPSIIAALLVIGLVVTGVWIWKRLSLDTQDLIVEQGIPVALATLAALAGMVLGIRKVKRKRANRQHRDRLVDRFERETNYQKRLDLAFVLIEVNEYRLAGLERIAPAMKDVFLTTLQTALGDKQHRVRGMAASHLGVLQDKTVVPALLKALEDDHAYVRSCSALALGRLQATEAKDKLAYLMKEDWDQTVRSRAREAFERL